MAGASRQITHPTIRGPGDCPLLPIVTVCMQAELSRAVLQLLAEVACEEDLASPCVCDCPLLPIALVRMQAKLSLAVLQLLVAVTGYKYFSVDTCPNWRYRWRWRWHWRGVWCGHLRYQQRCNPGKEQRPCAPLARTRKTRCHLEG